LQLFAAWLLQRVQLFAARLMQLLQLFAAGRAAWWLPSAAWSVVRVPGAGGCRALPGGCRPSWSRSCCLVPVFVFVFLVGRCL